MDRFGMGTDYSNDPEFTEAVAKKVYYGPVYLSEKSEPNMTLSVAGTRQGTGVTSARVNLRSIGPGYENQSQRTRRRVCS